MSRNLNRLTLGLSREARTAWILKPSTRDPLGVQEARSTLDSAYRRPSGVMEKRVWSAGTEWSVMHRAPRRAGRQNSDGGSHQYAGRQCHPGIVAHIVIQRSGDVPDFHML